MCSREQVTGHGGLRHPPRGAHVDRCAGKAVGGLAVEVLCGTGWFISLARRHALFGPGPVGLPLLLIPMSPLGIPPAGFPPGCGSAKVRCWGALPSGGG